MTYSINGKSPYKLHSLPDRDLPTSSRDLYDVIEEVAAGSIDVSCWSAKELDALEREVKVSRLALENTGWVKKAFFAIRYGTSLGDSCENVLRQIKKVQSKRLR
ncbi:MAG: hypothetical protein K0S07_1084 [Chlamydiales bacterium]|jgi:hypothetical protein|nr:hypothetical protein [Chlamydiales bacterium]